MTSANVTYYYVYRGNELVLKSSQHHLCKNSIEAELRAIENPAEYTLRTNWPDENEAPNWTEHGTLAAYIQKLDQRDYERRRSGKIWTAARKEIERENPGIDSQEQLKKTLQRAEMIDHAIGTRNWEEKLERYFS